MSALCEGYSDRWHYNSKCLCAKEYCMFKLERKVYLFHTPHSFVINE